MKYLILSDIHSNIEALDTVLGFARKEGYDEVLLLGDLIGYCASPNEVVETLAELSAVKRVHAIGGNHERALENDISFHALNEQARQSLEWTRERITSINRKWLSTLPEKYLLEKTMLLVHGSPGNPDEYILGQAVGAHAIGMLPPNVSICFFGHTHLPTVYSRNSWEITGRAPSGSRTVYELARVERHLVNPGSVGQPRDGNAFTSFSFFDLEKMTVEYIRIPYDIEKTIRKIKNAGLPEKNAERLRKGK